jgi:hypothetical protein
MNLGKKEYLKIPFKGQGLPSKGCGSSRPFRRSRRIRIRFDGHSSGRCRCEQFPGGKKRRRWPLPSSQMLQYRPSCCGQTICCQIQIVGPPPLGPTESAVLLPPVAVAPRPLSVVRLSRCGRRVVH